jgi:hypothetical protein
MERQMTTPSAKRPVEPHTYALETPPIAASAGLHARACSAHFTSISDSKIRRVGLSTFDDNGRRSIVTTDFWGWRLASVPDRIAETMIERFPPHMRQEIRNERETWQKDQPPVALRRGHNLHPRTERIA